MDKVVPKIYSQRNRKKKGKGREKGITDQKHKNEDRMVEKVERVRV